MFCIKNLPSCLNQPPSLPTSPLFISILHESNNLTMIKFHLSAFPILYIYIYASIHSTNHKKYLHIQSKHYKIKMGKNYTINFNFLKVEFFFVLYNFIVENLNFMTTKLSFFSICIFFQNIIINIPNIIILIRFIY